MRTILYLIIPLVMLILPINSSASGIKCAIEKYRQYATAQEQWQRASSDMIVNANNKFKDIAILGRDMQLYDIEMKLIETEYMVANAPDRVRYEGILNGWFTLNSKDKAEIAKSNPRYTELLNLWGATSSRYFTSFDDSGLGKSMQNQTSNMPEFQNLLHGFSVKMVKINNIVCAK